MKPAPPSMSALGIADARVTHTCRPYRLLVEDAPAIVEHGRVPQSWQEPPQIELGVLGMVGDDEHGVGALEGRFRGHGLSPELANDTRRDQMIVAAKLEPRGAEERQHRENRRAA